MVYRYHFGLRVCCVVRVFPFYFFFYNDTATTEIYTLSLHDALPIYSLTVNAGNGGFLHCIQMDTSVNAANQVVSECNEEDRKSGSAGMPRPISYAVFCLKKKNKQNSLDHFII